MTGTTSAVLSELKAIRSALEVAARPPAELLSREAMAAALDIGVSTFDKLVAARQIGPRSFKVGGSVRWHAREVREWLAHPTPAGELMDRETWPALWAELQRRK